MLLKVDAKKSIKLKNVEIDIEAERRAFLYIDFIKEKTEKEVTIDDVFAMAVTFIVEHDKEFIKWCKENDHIKRGRGGRKKRENQSDGTKDSVSEN